jgi:hypothetical protein
VNAFNCRFQLWIADALTRYTVQTAINYVCGYKLPERHGAASESLEAAGKNRRIFTIYLTGSICAFPAM